jgi:hypothetical protein
MTTTTPCWGIQHAAKAFQMSYREIQNTDGAKYRFTEFCTDTAKHQLWPGPT